jgi:LPXTG-motif cell wall-anchored protein
MKHVKRIVAFAMTLIMAFAIGVPVALAADLNEVTAGTAKSITITTPDSAQTTDSFTYTVYKVFDATNDGTNGNISYKAAAGTTIVATDQLSKFEADASGNVRYYVRASESDVFTENTNPSATLSNAMIEAIASYDGKDEVGTVSITGPNTSKTVDVGSYGYFYITTTAGTVVTVDSANPNAVVVDKNSLPTMDKDIESVEPANGGNHTAGADNENNGESATASVGDTINYIVTINAKKGADSYVYHDVLSAGLTLVTETEPEVKVGNTALVENTDYTLTKFENNATNGLDDNITITFSQDYLNTITEDTTITITYSAILNDNAVIGDNGNANAGTLDYGHNANGDPNTTPPDEPKVYSYKFQLVKDDNEDNLLTGAEFKLYQDQACTSEIKLVKVKEGEYRVATADEIAATGFTAATIEAGTPKINGLGNGTYYLLETKAPDGYNKLGSATEVNINDANNEATLNGNKYVSGGVEVENQSGVEMPSTGGIGTTIFYVVGGVMVAGAAIFLLTKRRANAAE